MKQEIERKQILGVPLDCVDWPSALTRAEALLDGPQAGAAVLAVNPEKVMAARSNPLLLRQLEQAALLLPDGIGVVLAARMLGARPVERVPGSEFMPALCGLAQRKGLSVFLFGGTERVNERAAAALITQFPGLLVAGRHNGFVAPEGMDALIQSINDSGASILFLALGSPKQELWIAEFGTRLKVRICQGVGGTFDVIAGEVKRAPALFRRFHLEWFYRLITSPTRARRQASLPKFAWLFLKDYFLGRGNRRLH
jgi:N-acetylglucosaminyldiphosphoundecaprenol N-acetyl-beta-D-mannosaminyltransferase